MRSRQRVAPQRQDTRTLKSFTVSNRACGTQNGILKAPAPALWKRVGGPASCPVAQPRRNERDVLRGTAGVRRLRSNAGSANGRG